MIDNLLLPISFTVFVFGSGLLIYVWRHITFHRQCPACNELDIRRIPRKSWIKKLPNTKAYQCTNCSIQFVRFGHSSVSATHRVKPHRQLDEQAI